MLKMLTYRPCYTPPRQIYWVLEMLISCENNNRIRIAIQGEYWS